MIPVIMKLSVLPIHKIKRGNGQKFILYTLVNLILLLNFGCSKLNCTRFEDILGQPTDLIGFSYKIAENLTERATPPLIPQHPDMPVVVTTFVDNNDLHRTSKFGRIVQEHIISRLAQLGYTVRELKAAQSLTISPKEGETILTRELDRLQATHEVQAILVGTISQSERILYISARLVDPSTRNIIATDDYRLCMDDNLLAMFGLRRQKDNDLLIKEPRQPLF